MGQSCQFFFRANGSADALTARITLRDAFDVPVVGCSLSVTVISTPLTLALCSCGPSRLTDVSDGVGAAEVVFPAIGGRGELGLEVSVHCSGNIGFWSERYDFTSTDLNGSCEAMGSTNVFDLGEWASGLPPGYSQWSDFNCDGQVNVFDLGDFAGGLNASCGP
jgi:hypothetical protein